MLTPAGRAQSAVLCDISGVLLNWEPRRVVGPVLGTETDSFLVEVREEGWHRRHDLGKPLPAGAADRAARRPERAAAARAWCDGFLDMYDGPEPGAVELFDAARSRTRVFLLSNAPPGIWPALLARFPLLGRADGAILSGDIGAAKPDPRAWAAARYRFGLDGPTLVLDDREENCAAARTAGFRALRVETDLARALPAVRRWLESPAC